MKLDKSKREKQIESFLNQMESQEEYEQNIENKINTFYKKYINELEDYKYVKNLSEYNNLKNGGYIRYFNLNDQLKWGGILIKKIKNNDMDLMVLSNSAFNRFTVSFQKNYVFYKEHQTASDITRKIFLSALEKYN